MTNYQAIEIVASVAGKVHWSTEGRYFAERTLCGRRVLRTTTSEERANGMCSACSRAMARIVEAAHVEALKLNGREQDLTEPEAGQL